MDCLIKKITNLISNFTWRKWCFISTEWCQGFWVLVVELPTLGSLELVALLGLNVAFIGAYSTDILQFWYHSIDIHSILLYVEFEDGLSISILKIRATHPKKLQLEIKKFLKKSKCRHPPIFSNPAFSISYHMSWLGSLVHAKDSKTIVTYTKE
jgi:hypothetical protein